MTDQKKMERNIGILDWGIVISVIILFNAIFIPSVIWEEEQDIRAESRHRMRIISNAEKFYFELTNTYTSDGNELFSLVEAAMDSTTADSLFIDKQKIHLGNNTYDIMMNPGFELRVDTTFTKPQILQRTFNDTIYQISIIDDETGDIATDWVNRNRLKEAMKDSLFQSIDSTTVVRRSERYTDYARNKFHLTPDLLLCPLTGKPYILEVDNSDESFPIFTVKSPVPEDYTERRFGIFKFEAGNHGFIKDGNSSWAEID